MDPARQLSDCTLYTFIDSAYLADRDPVVLAEELCNGGSDMIQLRGKDWPKERIRAVALEILPVVRNYRARLVVNDHWEIAQEIGADFCHMGQEDFFESGCRHVTELPGAGMAPAPGIGLSTHNPDQAERALRAEPAYIAVGPVYPTATKPQAEPVTLEYVRWAAANVRIPWFAIGGITLGNLVQVLAAGATRISVVSAILKSADVAAACRQFKDALSSNAKPAS